MQYGANLVLYFVGVLLLVMVFRPLVQWLSARDRPNVSEWKRIRGHITGLTRGDVANMTLSPSTRVALNMVLSDRPGVTLKSNMPVALQVLEDSASHATATLRSLSTISVFIGLLGTAIIFALTLDDGLLSGDLKSDVLKHLRLVYFINGLAILLATLIYAISRYFEGQVAALLHEATSVMSELPDRAESEIDPMLLETLQALLARVAEAFQQSMGELQEQQLGDIRAIVAEVRGLAASIRGGVDAMRLRSETDLLTLIEADRATLTAVEASAVRLESALGQMVRSGTPALERLEEASTDLARATERFQQSGVLAAVSGTREAVTCLQNSVSDLPAAVGQAVTTATSAISSIAADQLGAAAAELASGVEAASGRTVDAIKTGVTDIRNGVSSAVAEAVSRHEMRLESSLASIGDAAESLRGASRTASETMAIVDATVRKLDTLVEKAAQRRIFR